MTMPELYERVSITDIFNAIEAEYQRINPAYQPSQVNPVRMLISVIAAREGVGREYFNIRALQLFIDHARGNALEQLGEFFGVPRQSGELDVPYRRRIKAHNAAEGHAGTQSAYLAQALASDPGIADALATTQTAAPNAGRTEVYIVASDTADDGGTLPGVPPASLLTTAQAYMRDPIRRSVKDYRLIAVAVAPIEYRISVDVVSPAPVAESVIRNAIYTYIDQHRVFGAVLRPSNLTTLLENIDGVDGALVETFNISPYNGTAILTATDEDIYSCQKNSTGVDITITTGV